MKTKKILAFLLCLVMMLSLAACGGGTPDPNAGKYEGYMIKVLDEWEDMNEIYGAGENYIELKNGGKAVFCIDGVKQDIKWTLSGTNITLTAADYTSNGTLENGVLQCDLFGFDFELMFVLEGAEKPNLGGTTEPGTTGGVSGATQTISVCDDLATVEAPAEGTWDSLWGTFDMTDPSISVHFYWCMDEAETEVALQEVYAQKTASNVSDWEETDMTFGGYATKRLYYLCDGDRTYDYLIDVSASGSCDMIQVHFTSFSADDDLSFVEPMLETLQVQQTAVQPTETPVTAPVGGVSEMQDYWDGEWYGWWFVSAATGEYEELDGEWWDACADIIYEESTQSGSITFWDEDWSRTDPMAFAEVSFVEGKSSVGAFVSKGESDFFDNYYMPAGAWTVDPAVGDVSGYPHMIDIEGSYVDPEDSASTISYHIYLRPWGMYWDDIEESNPDDLPYYYDDWYLPLIEANKPMPDLMDVD